MEIIHQAYMCEENGAAYLHFMDAVALFQELLPGFDIYMSIPESDAAAPTELSRTEDGSLDIETNICAL